MGTLSRLQLSRKFIILGLIIALIALPGCALRLRPLSSIPTIDARATNETKALFINLWTLASSKQTLFGHQDDLAYGIGWRGEPGRSDVFEVTGSYPAVYGWDVGGLELGGDNVDGVPFDAMRTNIMEGYRRGGVITISWHMSNPVTGGDFYDMTEAVSTILPGGSNHDQYRRWLDEFAAFSLSLTVSSVPWNNDEHLVPVIFRPFHEHNTSVFWWGGRNTTEADFIELWRFTVQYLRDLRGVHNLLYAYSPDARVMRRADFQTGVFANLADFQTQYFYAYPGDNYVDVLGLDNYADPQQNRLSGYESSLEMLIQTAHSRSDLKIPALTETGLDKVPDNDWWTTFLYPALIGSRSSARGQVAWALVWRNAAEDHHFAPYPEHPSAEDFVKFKERPMIHFEDEIPFNLYTWP